MIEVDPEEVQRMTLGYERQIRNQRDSITRLLSDPDAAAEIAQLNELLAKAQEKVRELEEYINASATSELEVVTKEATPEDPAETKEGESGPPEDWTPPVDVHRPMKTLPSL